MRKVGFLFLVILSSIILAGCSNNNKPFVEGEQKFKIKDYNLQQEGFKGLEDIFRAHVDMPNKLLVDDFEGDIDKDGMLQDFSILIKGYNDKEEYIQSYIFHYNYKKKKLKYLGPNSNIKSKLQEPYNKNSEISYLDAQLKEIPINHQVKKLTFDYCALSYSPNLSAYEGDPIIEKNNQGKFPVLSFEEYKQGKGGKGDGNKSIFFILHDRVSAAIGENRILYKCDAADESELYTKQNGIMQKDYRVTDDRIKFTRDYGKTWIECNASADILASTIEFYRLGVQQILEDSYYISDNPGGTIAFVYGENPMLLLSKDDGVSWNEVDMKIGLGKEVTRRSIGFTSEAEGYAAMGTDWTMGSGEGKMAYFTNDGGLTWTPKDLPEPCSSRTLTGMRFADSKNGILSLDAGQDANEPLIYITMDRGDTWSELVLPWNEMDDNIQYLTKVDSLTYKDGIYTIVLGQGEGHNIKAVFESKSLKEGWKFKESYKSVGHFVG